MSLVFSVVAIIVAGLSALYTRRQAISADEQVAEARRANTMAETAHQRALEQEAAEREANRVRWHIDRTEAGLALRNTGTEAAEDVEAWTFASVFLSGPLLSDNEDPRQMWLAVSHVPSNASVRFTSNDLTLKNGRPKWYIPMVAPIEHEETDLPVEPYLAGVMLGNADFTKGVISLNKEDRDIVERITTPLVEYPTTTALRFRPIKANALIDALGQRGVAATDKFVPQVYLTADLGARREILAGLLDTDGGVRSGRGSAQFHTTSLALAGGVRTLVESLGGTARVRVLARGEVRVDINITENPFRSQRKASQWKMPTRGPSRSIVSIEPIEQAEVRCIRVAADDHLYVTERYLVTHNTTMARLIAKTMGVDIIELVPPFNIHTLVEAAQMLKNKDILFIDEIHKLADSGKRGAEILLKLLEEKVAFLPDGQAIRLNDITIIGATTDKDKLPEPVIDRFKIKPYFQAYSWEELSEIAVQFAFRHRAEDLVDDAMAVGIAAASRGTPRIIEEMVISQRDLSLALQRPATKQELLEFMEVEPDGLTRVHVHYLTAMLQYFARETKDGGVEYIVGEAAIQQILRETKQGIQRVEAFLVERGLIDRTPRGRRLTGRGIAKAQEFIAAGKGAADVA